MTCRLYRIALASCFLAFLVLGSLHLNAAEGLHWDHEKQTLDAELTDAPLIPTLEDLALQTGWQIYLEPTPGKTFTTKFAGLSRGAAMRILIGEMNYAFIPGADGPTRLLIFRTSREAATIKITGSTPRKHPEPTVRKVGNQLIVKLKPGARIEEIAAKLGAKVKGRIGDLNAYLLEFEDDKAVEKARSELASHDDVDSTDYNYYVERPDAPQPVTGNLPPRTQLTLSPGASGNLVVGLIDTAMRPLGNGLDKFVLPQISVAGEPGDIEGMTHGPAMAETLLRALQLATGGSTEVQIRPVDVYGPNQTATTFDVGNGIIRVVNSTPTPSIINLSLGSYSDSTFLRNIIQQVSQQGVVVFAAAGNDPVTTPFLPAAWPEVISVTASDGPGHLASYANRADSVDVLAPGTSVVYLGNQAYAVSGTSAASAYAAGLTAGLADARGITAQSAATTIRTAMPFSPGPSPK
jgi:hypothetical protein